MPGASFKPRVLCDGMTCFFSPHVCGGGGAACLRRLLGKVPVELSLGVSVAKQRCA